MIVSMSELDRQLAIFNKKMPDNPDQVVKACSVIKHECEDGETYWFLTDDDQIIKVTTRESERWPIQS